LASSYRGRRRQASRLETESTISRENYGCAPIPRWREHHGGTTIRPMASDPPSRPTSDPSRPSIDEIRAKLASLRERLATRTRQAEAARDQLTRAERAFNEAQDAVRESEAKRAPKPDAKTKHRGV
jgi:hypothetical protein